VTGLNIDAVVVDPAEAERLGYGEDAIWLRAIGRGDVQVADYTSSDCIGPPPHSHPWDEVQIVVEGEAEFLIGAAWRGGGSGTVQLLPRGVAHSVRVPAGRARIIQVTIGAPYDGFARAMARLSEDGASLPEFVAEAARHGVLPGPPFTTAPGERPSPP
jgi:mannose-6-phosphate isomerase-like protein (cupin superfamily)